MDTSRYFIDGYSSRNGVLAIVAYPNALKGTDSEHTTFYTTADGEWGAREFEFDGRSVTYASVPGTKGWWLLGKRGEVVHLQQGNPHRHDIAGAGTGPDKRGYVNRIAEIGGTLYVCGVRRQVYRRVDSRWEAIDAGIYEPSTGSGVSLEAIDGTSPQRLFAVGNNGEIWAFDGEGWRRRPSPTNAHLNEVRCLADGRVLIAGHGGTVLIGDGDGDVWDVISNKQFAEPLWGIEEFAGDIYVAGYSGIGKVVGDGIEPVDTGLGKTVLGYRLRAKDGILWSIGNTDLLRNDGQRWEQLVCPDN